MAETTGEIISDKDALKTGFDMPALWLKKIERAKKDEEAWRKNASEAIAIYEAGETKDAPKPSFNILHSNIEITVPSLYNSTPIPDVRRRFGDADPMAKIAVDVIERALSYTIDTYDFDGQMVEVTRDAELAGRGQLRIRYTPNLEEQTDEAGEVFESVGYQEVTCEHVIWDRWGHGPARHWAEVPWIYFEHDLTHDDLVQLGVSAERIKKLAFDGSDQDTQGDKDKAAGSGVLKTVRAYEVWERAPRKVFWVAEQDKSKFLAVQDDPLKLEQFFPVPKPMQPLRIRTGLTPIVPYKIYEPQVRELDRVTTRINNLVAQLKVRGIYDKRMSMELEMLRECVDGQYVPVDDAAAFSTAGGGLDKAVAHWPLAEIVAALQQLYVQREQIKQVIYEITGLSDVLRGATDPNETLGAQQLKAQQGSTRLSQRQRMVSDVARDVMRMKAEIISNHFTTENLAAMTSIQIPPEAEQVLRSDLMRAYRIDVEADSTVRADLARTQEQINLFLQSTGTYATAMAPIMMQMPDSKAAIMEIYGSFARHFKLGKSAEDALEKVLEAARQPQPPPPPSPEEQKAQLEAQKMQQQAALDQQKGEREMAKMQAELQMKQQMAEIDMHMKQVELQLKQQLAELEMQKAQMELGLKRETMALDREAKVFDIQTKQQMTQVDIQARREKAEADSEANEMKLEHSRMAGEEKLKQQKAQAAMKPKSWNDK